MDNIEIAAECRTLTTLSRRKSDDGFVVLYWDSSHLHLASTTWDYDNS
jgi:hypothetical protein